MQQLPLILVILFSYIIFILHLEFHENLSTYNITFEI
jgi:hypothetical protein